MLRLVHPPPVGGQGTDPPAGRRRTVAPALSLTPEENRHAHAALRNAARAYGGLAVLASAMGLPHATLKRSCAARYKLSGTFAIRLAKAAGVAVEAMLSGSITDAGRCKACGARVATGRALTAGGAR